MALSGSHTILPNLKNSKFLEIGKSSNSKVFKWVSLDDLPYQTKSSKEQDEKMIALKTVTHKKQNTCEDECKDLQNEYQILKMINHPHIVQVFAKYDNTDLFHDNQEHGCQMALELALFDGIELINYCGQRKKNLDLQCIQSIFWQICRGVQALHDRDITHNDLKLDNILVFKEDLEKKQFLVKIADFGHATHYYQNQTIEEQGKKFRQKIQEYMAPELLNLQVYTQQQGGSSLKVNKIVNEKKTDIFSLGVSLFMAVIWKYPYRNIASEQDKIFQHLFHRKIPDFWATYAKSMMRVKKNNHPQLVEYFQDLVVEMLSPEEDYRPNIDQILKHPFFKKCN